MTIDEIATLVAVLAGFAFHDINSAAECRAIPDRDSERNDLGAEAVFQRVDQSGIVHMILIHTGNEEHAGKSESLAEIPCPLNADLNAGLG